MKLLPSYPVTDVQIYCQRGTVHITLLEAFEPTQFNVIICDSETMCKVIIFSEKKAAKGENNEGSGLLVKSHLSH